MSEQIEIPDLEELDELEILTGLTHAELRMIIEEIPELYAEARDYDLARIAKDSKHIDWCEWVWLEKGAEANSDSMVPVQFHLPGEDIGDREGWVWVITSEDGELLALVRYRQQVVTEVSRSLLSDTKIKDPSRFHARFWPILLPGD